ncbi:hydroxyacid dehydrogenase [Aquincola tertiaricarbonis]|uniref:hydroxyacid dehydrogenase n=1 Tax=Aquincola tertiaricarbonis TaxID=391953 RepID=UPI000614C69E|nr:hydroxyacid dehydrogenase [Aquincola tertiaricarbonis]
MSTVYVSEPIHPQVLREIAAGADLLLGYGPTAVAYESVAYRVDAVMLRSERFPAARIVASPRLKVIARHGAGLDTVDVATALEKGIAVTYCPGGNANAVAEHVFALVLALGRRVVGAHLGLCSQPWPKAKQHLVGQELGGRIMGIVGFGEIGKLVARIARGFSMEVWVHDPFADAAAADEHRVRLTSLDDLLSHAGVVSLHAPLTPITRHMISAERLARMPSHALLINTARSGLIDEAALVDALSQGRIAGAALDVADAEQAGGADVRFGGRPLSDVPNLLLTPHIAGQTDQALLNVGSTAWHDIKSVLAGQAPRFPVRAAPRQ